MAKVMTYDIEKKTWTTGLLVTYTPNTGENTTHCVRPHRVCTWDQNKPEEAMGGRLCSVEEVRCPLVPERECDWIVWIIQRASKELKPTT